MTPPKPSACSAFGRMHWCGQKADGTGSYARLHTEAELRALMGKRGLGQMMLEGVV
jgi:hypothetical protein